MNKISRSNALSGHNSFFLIIAATLLLICAGACGSRPDTPSLYLDAETAFASHNYPEARALCDTIIGRARGGEVLPPHMACRLALMLASLGDEKGLDDDNTVAAWFALRQAMDTAPDSVTAFVRELDREEQGILLNLMLLNVRTDTLAPVSFPDEYEYLIAPADTTAEPNL